MAHARHGGGAEKVEDHAARHRYAKMPITADDIQPCLPVCCRVRRSAQAGAVYVNVLPPRVHAIMRLLRVAAGEILGAVCARHVVVDVDVWLSSSAAVVISL